MSPLRRDSHLKDEADVQKPALIWDRADGSAVEFGIWPERPVSIGRDQSNAIVLESSFVSKNHAVFSLRAGQYEIEDLRSANGTRVNGAPVATSIVNVGDVIEIGDQRLTFVDRAAPAGKAASAKARGGGAAAGGSKLIKLGAVAGGTLLVLILMMRMMLGGGEEPQVEATPTDPAANTAGGAAASPAAGAGAPAATGGGGGAPASGSGAGAGTSTASLPPISPDSPRVREVTAHAQTAGVNVADALYDDANAQYQAERYLESAHLYAAVLARDGTRELAKVRLSEVRQRLEGAITQHAAEAERLTNQLRYEDAIGEWEQVLLLVEPPDPRVAKARAGIDDAKKRMGVVR